MYLVSILTSAGLATGWGRFFLCLAGWLWRVRACTVDQRGAEGRKSRRDLRPLVGCIARNDAAYVLRSLAGIGLPREDLRELVDAGLIGHGLRRELHQPLDRVGRRGRVARGNVLRRIRSRRLGE